MSNCYLTFCARIDGITKDEEKWLDKALNKVRKAYLNGSTDDEGNFEFSIEELNDERARPPLKTLFFESQESGDPQHVAKVVQAFFKEFRPNACFSLTYAWYSDRLDSDSAGGGAIFVMAKHIEQMDAAGWVETQEKRKEIADRIKAKKAKK